LPHLEEQKLRLSIERCDLGFATVSDVVEQGMSLRKDGDTAAKSGRWMKK